MTLLGRRSRAGAVFIALLVFIASTALSMPSAAAQQPWLWFQVGQDIDGSSPFGEAGTGVSLSADGLRLAVGSQNEGRVQVYEQVDASWVPLGGPIYGIFVGDGFGHDVSLSADGTVVAAGAVQSNLSGSGYAQVFKLDTGTWTPVGNPLIGDVIGDAFGEDVELSADGSRVVVGSPFHNSQRGQVKVFEDVNGSWIQLGASLQGQYGSRAGSVSTNAAGTRIAIGAPGWNSNDGQVRIFDWKPTTGLWQQVGNDIDGSDDESLGWSVSLDKGGKRLAVGSPDYGPPPAADYGRVQVFGLFRGNSTWARVGNAVVGAEDQRFGWSVSLAASGSRVAIGTIDVGSAPGFAVVYENSGSNWNQLGQTLVGDAVDDAFGWRVAMSANGKRVGIGAPHHDSGRGQVKVFRLLCAMVAQTNPPAFPAPKPGGEPIACLYGL